MKKIICDTTIWYDKKHFEKFKGKLTATYISLNEISLTRNMFKNTGLWKFAIKNIRSEPADCYYSTPSEFLIHNGNEDVEKNAYGNLKEVIDAFDTLALRCF